MHTAPLLASTGFYPHFTMLRIRSIGFGSHPSDSRRFHTALLIACERVAFAAASCRMQLALPLKCTPWHVIPNVRHKHECPCRSMSIRFQALLTPCHGFFSTFPHGTRTLSVLRRMYGWKLVPPDFLLRFRGAVLWILPQLAVFSLRGCHPVSQYVPVHFAFFSEA